MKRLNRVLAALLLAGCALDEVWHDDVVISNPHPQLAGELHTYFNGEGKDLGCSGGCVSSARVRHGGFSGAGEFLIPVVTESADERDGLEIMIFCNWTGETGFEFEDQGPSRPTGPGSLIMRSLWTEEVTTFVVPDTLVEACDEALEDPPRAR